ncbi:MAG: hypothetical protein PF440_05590 [Thiomicrorhabdus sp.]|jgi:hypothetical protein|nr:hypothetical protein [Thiomicrorhabdus sp.]
MAANRFGIDLAEIYRNKANLESSRTATKGAKTVSRLNQLKVDEAEAYAAERPERKARKNKVAGLRGEASQGDEQAQRQLLALDPENGPKFIEAVGKMDDKKKAEAQKRVDQLGNMTATILQSPVAERPSLYAQMLTMLSPEAAAKMPPEYDENFMNMSLAKQRSMDKILEVKSVSFGGEDVMVKGGREVGRADKPVKDGSAAGGTKSADESLIYRQSAELLGGVFDQNGNITNLDPAGRNKVQSIATEASNIYAKAKGKLTRAEAVKRAANKFGVNVKDVPPADVTDPANIRNFLMQ